LDKSKYRIGDAVEGATCWHFEFDRLVSVAVLSLFCCCSAAALLVLCFVAVLLLFNRMPAA